MRLRAISSGSTLYAQVYALVCRVKTLTESTNRLKLDKIKRKLQNAKHFLITFTINVNRLHLETKNTLQFRKWESPFWPLKPHFYIVKLGFTGFTLFFLFLLNNIYCGYSLEPPRRGGSNEYPQSIFWAKIWKKYQNFLSENVHVFGGNIFSIFE